MIFSHPVISFCPFPLIFLLKLHICSSHTLFPALLCLSLGNFLSISRRSSHLQEISPMFDFFLVSSLFEFFFRFVLSRLLNPFKFHECKNEKDIRSRPDPGLVDLLKSFFPSLSLERFFFRPLKRSRNHYHADLPLRHYSAVVS